MDTFPTKVKSFDSATSLNLYWQFCAAGQTRGRRNRGWACYLDFGMVRGNAKPDQTKRHGESLIHVDLGWHLGHDSIGCVESCRAGANYGHPKRWPMTGGGRGIFPPACGKAAQELGCGSASA